MALLDLVRRAVPRPVSLAVLHFDHASGPHAERARAFVRRLAGDLGLPLEVGRMPQEAPSERGREAAWREARYAWFAARLDPEAVLLTAHHADDRLETVLLALLRGAGLRGLDPMGGGLRPFGRGYLARPLLGLPAVRIAAYARARGLAWVEDPTNADLRPARNHLRHRVLSSLAARWPEVSRSAAAGLEDLAAESARLARDDARLLAVCLRGHVLDLARLRALPPAERRAVLRLWLVRHGGACLPRPRFETLEALASGECRGEITGAEGRAYALFAGGLWPRPPLPPPPGEWEARVVPGRPVELPPGYGRVLVWGTEGTSGGRVRFRRGGESLRWGREGTRLQEFLRRRGIPPWLRGRLPLLFVPAPPDAEGRIVAVLPDWSERNWHGSGARAFWFPESEGLVQSLLDVRVWGGGAGVGAREDLPRDGMLPVP